MNHRALEALRAFVETGSLSRAGERFGRTQPQIGRLISALEAEVGFLILNRATKPLSLTRQGREFYRTAEPLLQGHDALKRVANDLRRGTAEHVRILTAPFLAHAIVADAVTDLASRLKTMTASIESRVHLDIEAWIGQEVFDLGVAVLPLHNSAFDTEEFLCVEAMLALPRDHPLAKNDVVTFDELVEYDVIVMNPRSMLRQHLERLAGKAGKTLKARFEATNGLIACQFAGRGLGCCLADPFVAASSGMPELVLRPFRPAFPLPYGFIFPTRQPRSQIVNELVEAIAEIAQTNWSYLKNGHDSPTIRSLADGAKSPSR